MNIDNAYVGEDVPIEITYTSDGTETDSDDTDSDGNPDAEITITDNSDGTEMVSAAAMTYQATGKFEYVWDTDVDAAGDGVYRISITAEFGGETKIVKSSIRLR